MVKEEKILTLQQMGKKDKAEFLKISFKFVRLLKRKKKSEFKYMQ